MTQVYATKRWRELRKRILKRDPVCRCGQPTTSVDHIQPFTGAADPLAWHESNLRGLCHRCHGRKDGKRRHMVAA